MVYFIFLSDSGPPNVAGPGVTNPLFTSPISRRACALLGLIRIVQIPMDDCLVGAYLACGLVMCAGCLHCSCHALESDGALERLLPSCGMMG